MAARSSARLIRRELRCALRPADMLRHLRHDAHPFALVGGWSGGGVVLGSEPVLTACPPAPLSDVVDAPLPFDHSASALGAFGGGWIGYLGYGLAREIHPLPQEPGGVRRLPLWWFGYYDHVLRLESRSGRWYFEALCAAEREDEIEHRYAELTSRPANRPLAAAYSCGEFLATPDRQAHIDSVARAIELIKRGDIFQANITLRLETRFSGDPLDFFCRGSEQLKPPFAAFIRLPEGAIASFSPELFLRRRGNAVLTCPIKGTSRRSGDADQAQKEREWLSESAKSLTPSHPMSTRSACSRPGRSSPPPEADSPARTGQGRILMPGWPPCGLGRHPASSPRCE
jgi:para-aminobenzoate synthetase / 4-amino-4-deoxychorismate lyase